MEMQERPEKLMTDYGRAKTKQKKSYNELLFNLKQYFGLFGKISNLSLTVLFSLLLGQYCKVLV